MVDFQEPELQLLGFLEFPLSEEAVDPAALLGQYVPKGNGGPSGPDCKGGQHEAGAACEDEEPVGRVPHRFGYLHDVTRRVLDSHDLLVLRELCGKGCGKKDYCLCSRI